MRSFFGLQKRYAEACLLQRNFLQPVEKVRLLPRPFMENRIGQREKTAAGSKAVQIRSLSELLDGSSLFGNGLAKPLLVDAGHIDLSHLFLQRHATQQVLNPLFDRKPWIAIRLWD